MSFGPSDWMKKATVLGYTRISDAKQTKSDRNKSNAKEKPALIEQLAYVNRNLASLKLPKVKNANWFAEVQSGTDRNRAQWRALQAKAMELAHSGKRVFIAIQDPSRWSRNTRHSLVAMDKLHDLGVPVLAVREGIQTGSAGDLHPTEELIFLQLQGGASFVSQEQKKKADQSVSLSKEAGIMAGSGQSLFPFAREDTLDAYRLQRALLTVPKSEGGGKTALKGTIEGVTMPNGMKATAVDRLLKREEDRIANLTEEEHQAWYDYRKKIQAILLELDHDPWARGGTKEGPISWKARALMRMVGRYLQEPWKYSQRTDEEIAKILDAPKDFLGTKDLARYRQIVGKR